MELALTALIWGITVIVYVVAGFAVMTIMLSIGFAVYLIILSIKEWWENRKFSETVRKAKQNK